MLTLLKNNWQTIITSILAIAFSLFLVCCESKVPSLNGSGVLVTRAELQFELGQMINTAEYRIATLDEKDQLKRILTQNALLIVQGDPFNPLGLVTAVAAFYGLTQATSGVAKKVKNGLVKKKTNNC